MPPEPSSREPSAAGAAPRLLFSRKVADYDASRPDYPEALFRHLRERVPTPGAVADLGAGTGLLTQGLLRHGFQVVAVEPDDAMRAAADHRLAAQPGYRSVAGTAERLPLPDCTIDLVTAAQAFHWFDPPRARAECRRVLRPAGFVALVWNERLADDPLQLALDEVLAAFGSERRPRTLVPAAIDAFFGATRPETCTWAHEHRLDAEGLTSLVFSRSYMPDRGTPAGAEAERLARTVFARCQRDGRVAVHYRTIAYVGRPA